MDMLILWITLKSMCMEVGIRRLHGMDAVPCDGAGSNSYSYSNGA